jgi:hypothetical protein
MYKLAIKKSLDEKFNKLKKKDREMLVLISTPTPTYTYINLSRMKIYPVKREVYLTGTRPQSGNRRNNENIL